MGICATCSSGSKEPSVEHWECPSCGHLNSQAVGEQDASTCVKCGHVHQDVFPQSWRLTQFPECEYLPIVLDSVPATADEVIAAINPQMDGPVTVWVGAQQLVFHPQVDCVMIEINQAETICWAEPFGLYTKHHGTEYGFLVGDDDNPMDTHAWPEFQEVPTLPGSINIYLQGHAESLTVSISLHEPVYMLLVRLLVSQFNTDPPLRLPLGMDTAHTKSLLDLELKPGTRWSLEQLKECAVVEFSGVTLDAEMYWSETAVCEVAS